MTEDPTRVLAEAARAAGRAPSVHNTQPWRWRVHPGHLELYADRQRQLAVADRLGRLLTISCGAALHHAQVAIAAAGWQPLVRRLPEPSDPDQLAALRLGDRLTDIDPATRRLRAAQRRRTDRRSPTDQPVPARVLAAIRAAVEEHHTHLHLLPEAQVSELAVAAGRADEQAAQDPAMRAELAYWVDGPHPPGTGLPSTVIPSKPAHTTVPPRDFGRAGTLPVSAGGDRAATYGLIFGEEDTPAGWLRAGEALSAAWLTATEHDVAVLPFSAAVESPTTRTVLRRLLAGLGHPYLVLRFGCVDPDQPEPPSVGRLEPTQTIEFVEGAA